MTPKATRILSLVLMILISLMVVMSAVMKLMGSDQVVQGMTKMGLGAYTKLLGVIELVAVALLFIPKTMKIGFLLLTAYLGGAICAQLSQGQVPSSAVFEALLWIAAFLYDKNIFLKSEKTGA